VSRRRQIGACADAAGMAGMHAQRVAVVVDRVATDALAIDSGIRASAGAAVRDVREIQEEQRNDQRAHVSLIFPVSHAEISLRASVLRHCGDGLPGRRDLTS
jgi:hypothetical protein